MTLDTSPSLYPYMHRPLTHQQYEVYRERCLFGTGYLSLGYFWCNKPGYGHESRVPDVKYRVQDVKHRVQGPKTGSNSPKTGSNSTETLMTIGQIWVKYGTSRPVPRNYAYRTL